MAATETARRHIAHEVEVAASSVRQLVRHTGRMATKFAQSLHIPAGMVAEQAKEASQQARASHQTQLPKTCNSFVSCLKLLCARVVCMSCVKFGSACM